MIETLRADRLASVTGGAPANQAKFIAGLIKNFGGKLPHLREMFANEDKLVATRLPDGKVKVFLPSNPHYGLTGTPEVLQHVFERGIPPH